MITLGNPVTITYNCPLLGQMCLIGSFLSQMIIMMVDNVCLHTSHIVIYISTFFTGYSEKAVG